jgi:16S rRNA (cytidine1402-2'-O)-methyltransferase
MSDAGCPGIADPGAELIRLAHAKNIGVIPLTGPSSIVLAIMASGFNGQNFAFNGYLPVDKAARIKRLRELESLSRKQGQAQFFIETPYRNIQMLETMLECLAPGTYCFVGKNIGGVPQSLRSATIADWKKQNRPDLHKIPVVFGLCC